METMLDRIIARRVCDGLYEDRAVRVETSGMRIASEGGVVILEGVMSCRAAKERAHAIAAAIQDVVRVEDRLTIRRV
jgi:osmotically-inducible protein OsmY